MQTYWSESQSNEDLARILKFRKLLVDEQHVVIQRICDVAVVVVNVHVNVNVNVDVDVDVDAATADADAVIQVEFKLIS